MRPLAARFAVPLFAVALAASPALPDGPAPDAAKVELKIDVKTGDVFYFRQKQSTDQAIQFGGMDMKNATVMTQTMTWTVAAVREDGSFDVKVAIGDIKGSFENPMIGSIEFDTSSGEDPASDNPMLGPMLKSVTMLANRSYEMTIDRRGTVKDLRGMKEILEDALKGNPMLGDKSIKGMLDDDAMKGQAQGQLATFPESPVAVGGKWEGHTSGKGAMGMDTATEYTLVSADAANAVISWKTKVKTTPDALAQVGADVEGGVTISRKDGMIVKSESSTHSVNDMDMPGGAAQAGGDNGTPPKMHIDMTVKVTLERVTAADVKPAPKKEPTTGPKPPVAPKAPDQPGAPK